MAMAACKGRTCSTSCLSTATWLAVGVGLDMAVRALASGTTCRDAQPRTVRECQASWLDCRVLERAIPPTLFQGCMELLGWPSPGLAHNFSGWVAPQQCNETASISLLTADSSPCDDLAVIADTSFILPGTCSTLTSWLNSDCARCDSWKLRCGCTWPAAMNAKPTCLSEHGHEKRQLLHGEMCSPQCLPGFATHTGPLVCQDGQLLTVDTPGQKLSTRPARFVCYDSPPMGTAPRGVLRVLDEDPRQGMLSGTVELGHFAPEVSAVSLYLGRDETSALGARLASVPLSPEDGSASHRLRSLALPEAATHLLALPENALGEAPAAAASAAALLDLRVEAPPGSGAAREPEPLEALALELLPGAGAGPAELAPPGAPWPLGLGAANCSGPSLGPPSLVQRPGGGRARFGLAWRLPGGLPGGTHTLCRLSLGAGGPVFRPAALLQVRGPPRLAYGTAAWPGGRSRLVEVSGSGLEANASSLALVPLNATETGCLAAGAVQGALVGLARGNGGTAQEWRVGPVLPGRYRLCWESCPSGSWDAACLRTRSSEDIIVAECDDSTSQGAADAQGPHLPPCVRTTPGTCATLGGVFVNSTSCQQRFPEGWTLPLVVRRLHVPAPHLSSAGTSLPTLQIPRDFDDRLVAVDVAEDMSYMLLARPAQHTLHVLRLRPGQGSSLFDRLLQHRGLGMPESEMDALAVGTGRPCEYLLPEVLDDLARRARGRTSQSYVPCGDDMGQDAWQVSFQRPVSVRIAPSGVFWLVADAWSHRVRRIDISSWMVRTVAGSGQASANVQRVAYKHFRAEAGLGFLHLLEGRFSGDGGLAVHAQLDMPSDVAIFSGDESRFLIADRMNHRIRQVKDGVITTVAGAGPPALPLDCSPSGQGIGDGGPAVAARLFEPTGVDYLPGAAGAFIVAERVCHRIRWVDACGSIRTLAAAPALRLPVQPRAAASGLDLVLLQDCPGPGGAAAGGARACGPGEEAPGRGRLRGLALPRGAGEGAAGCAAPAAPGPAPAAAPAGSAPLEPLGLVWGDGAPGDGASAGAAGVAAGADGSLLVVDERGGVFEVGRRPLSCPGSQRFDPWLSRCVCQSGTRNSSDSCTPCSPGHICDGSAVSYPCPGLQTTFRGAALFGDGVRRCAADGPDFNLTEGTLCLSTVGAASRDECTCPHGLYKDPSSATCRACPGLQVAGSDTLQGLLCPANWSPGVGQSHIHLQNGFWAEVSANGEGYHLFKCQRASDCWWTTHVDLWNASVRHGCLQNFTACAAQGGWTGGRPDACRHNRDGFTCGRCAPGFVEDIRGHCGDCGGVMNSALIVSKILLYLLMLATFYSFLNTPKGGKFMATYMLSTAATSLAEFVQQYNLVAMVVLPPMPAIDALLRLLPSFVLSLVPAECLWQNAPGARYPMALALPWSLAAGLAVLVLLERASAPLRGRLPREAPAALPARARRCLGARLGGLRGFRMERNKTLNTLGFCLVALYSETIRVSLAPFQAREHAAPPEARPLPGSRGPVQPAVWTLMRYPDVQEGAAVWWVWLPCGVASVLAYTVGMFAFHCLITYRAPQHFALYPSFRARHKYFYAKYRDNRYYWGLVVMSRAILTNIVGLLGHRVGRMPQAQAFVAINAAFLLLLCVLSPYKNVLNSQLDALLNCVLLCMQVVGMAGFSAANKQHAAWNGLVLGAACALSFAIVMSHLLRIALLPDRWSKLRDESAVQLAYVVKSFCSRVVKLRSRTLLVIAKSFSISERLSILRGLRFLEPGAADSPGAEHARRISAELGCGPRRSRFSLVSSRPAGRAPDCPGDAPARPAPAGDASRWSGLTLMARRLSGLRSGAHRASSLDEASTPATAPPGEGPGPQSARSSLQPTSEAAPPSAPGQHE